MRWSLNVLKIDQKKFVLPLLLLLVVMIRYDLGKTATCLEMKPTQKEGARGRQRNWSVWLHSCTQLPIWTITPPFIAREFPHLVGKRSGVHGGRYVISALLKCYWQVNLHMFKVLHQMILICIYIWLITLGPEWTGIPQWQVFWHVKMRYYREVPGSPGRSHMWQSSEARSHNNWGPGAHAPSIREATARRSVHEVQLYSWQLEKLEAASESPLKIKISMQNRTILN